jgi:hypothetical protein
MIATVWSGSATPTVPSLRSPRSGLQVETQVPSVSP